MYAARRTGLKREMFGYVEGGYAHVLSRLRELLERQGVVVRTGAAVQEVRAAHDGATVVLASGERLRCDAAVSSIEEVALPSG